nr:hypothetical protein [Bacillus sp. REN10]
MDVHAVQATLDKINQLQLVVKSTLKPNRDFGIIPGTTKPTLLKPGAEKIQMLFGVTSEYEVTERIQDYDKGFFAFTVCCRIYKNDMKITEGIGHCNTREKKYKNQDSYSVANTCLKMAKKRAQIDATLTIASLSDIFGGEMEDDLQDYLQTEQIETMTSHDAGAIKLTFGKFKGKTLGDIYRSDKSYLTWLVGQDRTDAVIKKAIETMFAAVEQSSQQSRQQEPKGNTAEDKTTESTKQPYNNPLEGDPIHIKDDDLPFNNV